MVGQAENITRVGCRLFQGQKMRAHHKFILYSDHGLRTRAVAVITAPPPFHHGVPLRADTGSRRFIAFACLYVANYRAGTRLGLKGERWRLLQERDSAQAKSFTVLAL